MGLGNMIFDMKESIRETKGMKTSRLVAVGLAAVAIVGTAVGCGGSDSDSSSGDGDLSGTVAIDGSSTVAPLSIAAADAFSGDNGNVDVQVGTSGTGGGFEKFCSGTTDISDASRAINDEEIAACKAGGVEFVELRVASDGITVVAKKDAQLGKQCISLAELKKVWEKSSKINNWSQIGAGWSDLPLQLAGPGDQSGTYDFFNEEVLGEDASGEIAQPRTFSSSEDDNVIVTAVEGTPGTMGYFGFTYFEENEEQLQALQLQGDGECVAPSSESITAGEYPLSRPLFLYVSTKSLNEKPQVKSFVRYYLENAVQLAEDTQFVPAPQDSLDESLAKVPA